MQKKKVLAVLEDLLFTVKINDAAKRAGLEVEILKSEKDVLEKAKEKPLLVIMDLNCACIEPIRLISNLKSSPETKSISIIAFLSHLIEDMADEWGVKIAFHYRWGHEQDSAFKSRIVVGEAGGDLAHNFQGASYIFTKPKIGWQTTSKYSAVLRASGDTGKSDAFGWSVAMSGARIAIGATEFLNGPGAAYIF